MRRFIAAFDQQHKSTQSPRAPAPTRPSHQDQSSAKLRELCVLCGEFRAFFPDIPARTAISAWRRKSEYATLALAMSECHCRVTLTDIEGGSHIVEVKASSLFEAIARALKLKGGSIATDGFRPIKVLVFEPKKEHEVRLKDFMAWLDRQGRSPREVIERRKISEILGLSKSTRLH